MKENNEINMMQLYEYNYLINLIFYMIDLLKYC